MWKACTLTFRVIKLSFPWRNCVRWSTRLSFYHIFYCIPFCQRQFTRFHIGRNFPKRLVQVHRMGIYRQIKSVIIVNKKFMNTENRHSTVHELTFKMGCHLLQTRKQISGCISNGTSLCWPQRFRLMSSIGLAWKDTCIGIWDIQCYYMTCMTMWEKERLKMNQDIC
jgi:hypothetical protein